MINELNMLIFNSVPVLCFALVLCLKLVEAESEARPFPHVQGKVLTISASQNPAPLGETIILKCNHGTAEFVATWLFNAGLLQEQSDITMTDTSLTLSQFQANQAGKYSCLNGDVISNELDLDYSLSTPTIRVNMVVPVLLGNDFMLTCVTQAQDVKFIWYRDHDVLVESGNNLVGEMLHSDAGLYNCVVSTDKKQSGMSEGVNIDFKVPQPKVVASTTHIGGTVFPVGADVLLECRINHDFAGLFPIVFWFKDNAMVAPDSSKYSVNDRGVLTIQAFELSDAGAISCLVEINGRQSERSENIALSYSVADVLVRTRTRVYNTSTIEPILLGVSVTISCVKDLVSLPHTDVLWYIGPDEVTGQEGYADIEMEPFFQNEYSCEVNYAGGAGRSARSPVMNVTYRVPKPTVTSSDSRSVYYVSESVTLHCSTGYVNDAVSTVRNFRWFPTNGNMAVEEYKFDEETLTIPFFHEGYEGSYSCAEGIYEVYSEDSDPFSITVAVPGIQLLSIDQSSIFPRIPYMSAVTLKCGDDISRKPVAECFWELDNVDQFGGQPSTVLTITMDSESGGNYSCHLVYKDKTSTGSSLPLYLDFEVPMPVVIPTRETTLIIGSVATLSCTNSAINQTLISSSNWFKNDVAIKPPQDNLVFDNVTITFLVYRYADVAKYSCINMVGGKPSIISNEYETTYEISTPSISSDTNAVSISGTIILQCVPFYTDLSLPSDIQWYKNGALITQDSYFRLQNTFLRVQNFQLHHCGSYQCVEQIGGWHSNHSEALVIDSFVPVPEIRPNQPVVSEVLGDSFKLFCGSQVPIETVQWRRDTVVLSWDNLNLTKVIEVTDRGQYSCRVSVDDMWSDWSLVQNVIFEVPAPEIHPVNHNISWMLGSQLELLCATKILSSELEWMKDNVILSHDLRYLVKVMSPEDVGSYACRISMDDIWSEWSPLRNVTFGVPRPSAVTDKNDVFLGDSFTVTCVSSYVNDEVTEREYDWILKKGKNITTHYIIDNNVIRIPAMARNISRTYKCAEIIYNVSSEISRREVVNYIVPQPSLNTPSTHILLNTPVQLTCNRRYDSMGKKSAILWLKDGELLDVEHNTMILNENDTALNISNFRIEDEGLYCCQEIVKGKLSEKSEAVSLLAIVPTPTAQVLEAENILMSSVPLVLGQHYTVSCNTTLGGVGVGVVFMWQKNEVNVPTELNSTALYRGEMRLEDSGSYKCRVYLPMMNRTSQWSPELNIDYSVPTPVVTVTYQGGVMTSSVTVTLGSDIQVGCSASIDEDIVVAVVWQKNGVDVPTELNSTALYRGEMRLEDFGSYKCRVYLPMMNRTSQWSPELNIDYSVPVPTLNCHTTTPMLGDTFHLECQSGYDQDHESFFLWYKDGKLINGQRGSTLTEISSVADAGRSYECQEGINNAVAVVTSDKSRKVVMSFEVPAPAVQSEPVSARVGEIVLLRCVTGVNEATYDDDVSASTQSDFIWYFGDQLLNESSPVLEVKDLQTRSSGPYFCQERMSDSTSKPSQPLSIEIQQSNYCTNNCSQEPRDTKEIMPVMTPTSQSSVPEGSTIRLRCESRNESYVDSFYWYKDRIRLENNYGPSVVIKRFTPSYDGNYSCAILHNGDLMHSASFLLMTVDAHALCTCPCHNTTPTVVMNETEMEEVVSSIKKNLTVNTASLSSKVRAKTSAPDSRPASVSVGSVAVCLLILVPTIVISFDCINLIAYLTSRAEYST